MQTGKRVGTLFGIPLLIDTSWFFVLILFSTGYALSWQSEYPGWQSTIAWATGISMALLFFASVLLHELGHSLVAKSQGIQVKSITLFFFGGVATIEQEPKTPGKAFQVAIAGPAVSLALFLLLSLLVSQLPQLDSPLRVLANQLAGVNLVLLIFNMLPGLPLDGGQVLKAAIWKLTGSQAKGTQWAAKAGKTLGGLAITLGAIEVAGLSAALGLPSLGGLWLILIGWFIIQNASSYDRLTHVQEALLKIKAQEAMTREFRVVDANLKLRQFADDYLLETSRAPVYFAASDGRYRGLIAVDALQTVERSQWETQTLLSIVQPLNEVPTVQEATSLIEVIRLMETSEIPRITVLSPAGAVSGVIDRGDIVRSLAQKMNLPISDAAIKQIKEEGSYPPGLQLGAIAQAAELKK
ncbi:site-2 protease family protein [Phormidesmis sp. 146-33]